MPKQHLWATMRLQCTTRWLWGLRAGRPRCVLMRRWAGGATHPVLHMHAQPHSLLGAGTWWSKLQGASVLAQHMLALQLRIWFDEAVISRQDECWQCCT